MYSYLFTPYKGRRPACLSLKEHKLMVLSEDPSFFDEHMGLFKADKIKQVFVGDSPEEQEIRIRQLAKSHATGVVFADMETDISNVLRTLDEDLPWLQ